MGKVSIFRQFVKHGWKLSSDLNFKALGLYYSQNRKNPMIPPQTQRTLHQNLWVVNMAKKVSRKTFDQVLERTFGHMTIIRHIKHALDDETGENVLQP